MCAGLLLRTELWHNAGRGVLLSNTPAASVTELQVMLAGGRGLACHKHAQKWGQVPSPSGTDVLLHSLKLTPLIGALLDFMV